LITLLSLRSGLLKFFKTFFILDKSKLILFLKSLFLAS
jgi:hypothetical protein